MNSEPLAGPYGGLDDENIPRFKDSAANAAWFHGFNEQMFARIESTGKAPCVEYKTFRADFSAHPDLIPIGSDGEPIRYGRLVQGVCLSKDWYVQERMEELEEGMKAFRPAGVWLDYLTYGGWFETPEPDLQESCFCEDCIADFCDSTGVDADTPERILSQYQGLWTRRKITRIAEFAETFSEIIKKHDQDCVVGAYMCPWRPDEFDGALSRIFAQDYSAMEPWIDVFTPLIYAEKSGRSPSWSREFIDGCREFIPERRKVQPILDYLDYPFSLRELTLAREPGWGVQVFGGNRIFSSPESAKTFDECVSSILASWNTKGYHQG